MSPSQAQGTMAEAAAYLSNAWEGQTLLGPGSTEMCASVSTSVCSPKRSRSSLAPQATEGRRSTPVCHVCKKGCWRACCKSCFQTCHTWLPWEAGRNSVEEGLQRDVSWVCPSPSHWLLWALLPLLTLLPKSEPLHSTVCADLILRGFVERKNRCEKGN